MSSLLDKITSIDGVPIHPDGFPKRAYEEIDHPAHYGGADDPYEVIRVIEAWGLGFCLGNTLKYISRAGKKPGVDAVIDLKKSLWYLQHEIERLSKVTP